MAAQLVSCGFIAGPRGGCIENAPRVSDFVYRYRCRVDSGRMPAAATRETGDQCLPACRVSSVWSQDSVWTPVGPGIGCLLR